ncbi:SIR2 family protein [Hydrogenophaga sp.]|uniref:SIR2 family protein n=1 Tax=Hydrogenophaga sp. TaxID=1904254 RepID=UPI00272F94D0|nr:SIR2 family protein [Hydrogenophaga sp.]MDP2072809.1 SIR2 family protein [Hydrogenophaga sp.]MDP3348298.1 SIR2 family protein [Hydrogenophaga sp.]
MPNAATITVPETLALLDGQFASVARAVAEDRYVLWLGSGISFGRVDGLRQVIARVLEFLRVRTIPGDPACRFGRALRAALELAPITPEEEARVDLTQPFATWPDSNHIVVRLCNNYARLLDINVQGESEDYLLWEAVELRATFADPAKPPDVEHLCLAMLVLEGACSDLASANWDGLIESAVTTMTGGQPALSVCARPEDLRNPALRGRLIKFHGCAVLATHNEAAYRPFLVARQSQINGWISRPENAAVRGRLVDLVATKPTLMIGLSAQDANIQALFAQAAVQMPWRWPGNPPSYVFSANELGGDQQGLLQIVYRQDMTPGNRQQIIDEARIQAYAKPLLLALVLHLLCSKIRALVDLAPGAIPVADRQSLRDGVIALRNFVAASVAPDPLSFINVFIDQWGRSLHLIRNGSLTHATGRYQPLTVESIANIGANPGLPASGLRETAVAAGLIGYGVSRGEWQIDTPASNAVRDGMFRLHAPSGGVKVFFTSGPISAMQLKQDGHLVDADEAIVIHGHKLIPAMARSPRAAPGRTGRREVREVSLATLLESSATLDELFQKFRMELAI